MTGLRAAFLSQADSCEALESPFMGRILRMLPDLMAVTSDLSKRCASFEGELGPSGHSLPLRIASGLHALVLRSDAPNLTAVYPPNDVSDDVLRTALRNALTTHDTFLTNWITNTPQTNEVRRSAVLIATAQLLADRFDLPFSVSEMGASGGLNLMFDRFHLAVGSGYGPQSDVVLQPDWRGPLPVQAPLTIAERRGVDLHPLDSKSPEHALRLLAYLWPDQTERMIRTRAAIALQDAPVDSGDAINWLQHRLPAHKAGQIHFIYTTVAWQYFPVDSQTKGTALIADAGAKATNDAPLAWLSYETDGKKNGAALTLRLWPGNHTIELGRADFHGRWINWTAPTRLP
ncbi:DUF2332 domain-containing protein [Shimia sp.]|uniref:DUF2332 domain-containing protein n=1 Tax=Shimia sp. TaxID=1954381 RepID=UPI003B8AB8F7